MERDRALSNNRFSTLGIFLRWIQFIGMVILSILSVNVVASEKLQVSPPYWWAGMQSQNLQLMIYIKDHKGHENRKTDPKLKVVYNLKGVEVQSKRKPLQLISSQQLSNPNYLFVNLKIDPHLKPGYYPLLLKKQGKVIATINYQFKQRHKQSKLRQGFNSADSVYLIMADRFANGDISNDQVDSLSEGVNRHNLDARHGGDIQGIIDHLDYIEQLGFTQLWLTPVVENNNPRYSYHGYAITDFYQVDPRLGSNSLYQILSKRAKKKGIGLIYDSVLNHISINHPWMQDLPSQDWINNNQQIKITNHSRETQQDPHGTKEDRQDFTDGWFVPEMPDLNQRNPFLATYLIQNNIWWIESADLSGIRIDTYSYSDKAFLSKFTHRILKEYPKFNMVGEEWSVSPSIVSYWQKDKVNYDGYQSYLPSLMDFPLQKAMIESLTEKSAWNAGMKKIYSIIATDYLYPEPNQLMIFADNHDMDRLLTQLHGDIKLAKMALVFLATTRGIPQVLYGTEVLMANQQKHNHGSIRQDFPGGWQGDKRNAFNAKGLTKAQVEMQSFTHQLFNWRKNAAVMVSSQLTHYIPKQEVYVYFRHNEKAKIMVILNKNNHRVLLDPKQFPSMLSVKERAFEVLTKQSIDLNKAIEVNAKQAMIIEIKEKE